MNDGAGIRWGLVGASSWAAEYMIDAFKAVAGGQVVAVFSASRQRGEEFARANGVDRAVASLEGLVGAPDIEAVYVSTTNDLHAEQVLAAARAGKHILCEKPMATTHDDALRMRDACEQAGVVLAINHHLRCQDTVRAMRQLVENGALGDVLAARCAHLASLAQERRTWRVTRPDAGAGVVLDLTVHDIDTLRYVLDDEIAEVTAMTTTHGVAQGDIEDSVAGTMRTARGALVSFQDAFTLGHAGTALEIHGTEGSLFGRDILGPEPRGDVFLRRGDTAEAVVIEERRNPYERVVEALVEAIAGRGEPAAGADDGVASLSVALAVLEAARTGRAVAVDRAADPQ